MRATFFGIEIGKRAILTQRAAMDVTSQNIANANTDGYTRQRAQLEATDPWTVPGFNSPVSAQQVGTGVNMVRIERLRDAFVDEKIRTETGNFEQRSASDDLLKEVESIFNEPSETSLRDQLDKFWAAWEDLSINPSTLELRRNLKEESDALISQFQDIDLRLRRIQGTPDNAFQGSIADQIADSLKQVNSLARQIADLNVNIEKVEVGQASANDLRDRRDKLVEDLAKQINVKVSYDSKGKLTIQNGSHTLVQHSQVRELFYSKKNNDDPGSITGQKSYPELSDKPSVASAALTHTEDLANMTITVAQTAQAHSVFSFLSYFPLTGPLSTFGVSSGTFTLQGRQFSLDAETTTIEDFKNRINAANIDINAKVNESGQLVLTSALTGTNNTLDLQNGTSNIGTVLNLQTDKQAQDAKFSVNGIAYTTQENIVRDAIKGATLFINGKGVANLDLHPTVTSGKLAGLLKVRDGNVQDVRDKLDRLVFQLVTEVNDVHRQGFGLDGKTNRNFFKPMVTDNANRPYKDAAKKIALEDFIVSDLNSIAASQGTLENPTDRLPTFNGAGDGKNAILIAQIKHKALFGDNKADINDFYNEIVTQVAVQSQTFERQRQSSNDLLVQLDGKRQEMSGVSLDEELTNIIKFQHAYSAAAKVISTVDEMLDKIINGMLR